MCIRDSKKIVYILTQANYEILLESGVQIYQYTPGFIHSKSFVCDDEVATDVYKRQV